MFRPAGSVLLFGEGIPVVFVVNQVAHFLIEVFIRCRDIITIDVIIVQPSDAVCIVVHTEQTEILACAVYIISTTNRYCAEIIALVWEGIIKQYVAVSIDDRRINEVVNGK